MKSLSNYLLIFIATTVTAYADSAESIVNALNNYQNIFSTEKVSKEELMKAKGIIILDYAEGAIGIGASSGSGVGMKIEDGKISAPVFLDVSGGSIGLQLGGGTTRSVLLLMDEKSLKFIDGGQTSFDGVAAATMDNSSSSTSTLSGGKQPSVLIYNSKTGAGFAASVGGVDISPDDGLNSQVYGVYPDRIMEMSPSKISNPNIRAAAESLASIIER